MMAPLVLDIFLCSLLFNIMNPTSIRFRNSIPKQLSVARSSRLQISFHRHEFGRLQWSSLSGKNVVLAQYTYNETTKNLAAADHIVFRLNTRETNEDCFAAFSCSGQPSLAMAFIDNTTSQSLQCEIDTPR
jgi:hypothetical protein